MFCELDIQGDRSPLRVSRAKILRAFTQLLRNCVHRARRAPAKEIDIKFMGDAHEVVIYMRDKSGIEPRDQDPLINPLPGFLDTGLDTPREFLKVHRGDLSYDTVKGFVITIPRDTGL